MIVAGRATEQTVADAIAIASSIGSRYPVKKGDPVSYRLEWKSYAHFCADVGVDIDRSRIIRALTLGSTPCWSGMFTWGDPLIGCLWGFCLEEDDEVITLAFTDLVLTAPEYLQCRTGR